MTKPNYNKNAEQDMAIARIEERVKSLESKCQSIENKIDNIKNNCLTEINKQIVKLDTNQKMLMFFMMAIIGALIGLYFR